MNNQSAIDLIKRANNILCITQKEASTDGIASLLALQVLCSRLKKKCQIVAPDNLNQKLDFLVGYDLIKERIPGSDEVVIQLNQEVGNTNVSQKNQITTITISPKNGKINLSDITISPKVADFDLIIAVDMPNLESLGKVFTEQVTLFSNTPIISISSNPSHDGFGRVVINSPQDSSSAEIIFNLIENGEFGKYLDETISTILLSGIISATGSFLGKNTTPKSLKAASKLQDSGAQQSDIIENLFKKKPLATLKIWGRILGNLQQDENHKFAWSSLQKSDFDLTGTKPSNIDDISDNLLRFTSGTDLYALLFEGVNETKIQIRTSNPGIDLESLNKNFQGNIVDNGLDITVKNKTISDVEGHLLDALTKFQTERYNLDPELGMKKKLAEKKHKSQTTHLNLHLKKKLKSAIPIAPVKIPFSAPLQPHEKTGKIGDNGKNSEPKKLEDKKPKGGYSPKQSGIPEWLKG